jgi:hypothetical protein
MRQPTFSLAALLCIAALSIGCTAVGAGPGTDGNTQPSNGRYVER